MQRVSSWASSTILAMVVFLSISEFASAQFPRFNRRLFGIIPVENLARLEVVQKAVSISDAQKSKIQELNVARNGEMQELFQSSNGDFDAIYNGILKMNIAYTEKLGKVLDEKQMKRITEIYLQVNNADTLLDADVVKLLKISDDQVKKITGAVATAREETFGVFGDQSGTEETRLKAQAEMVSNRDKKLLGFLTDDQKKEFEKAKGEKLEVDLEKLPSFGE